MIREKWIDQRSWVEMMSIVEFQGIDFTWVTREGNSLDSSTGIG